MGRDTRDYDPHPSPAAYPRAIDGISLLLHDTRRGCSSVNEDRPQPPRPKRLGRLPQPLFAGYCLYGLNTVLLVFALRDGELSILYPIIALTYVWVTILSVVLFHETMNFFKLAGVTIVVIGVAVMGKGRSS